LTDRSKSGPRRLQPVEHQVEAADELSHFIVGADFDATGEVVGLADVLSGSGDLGQRGQHAPGREPGQRSGKPHATQTDETEDETQPRGDAVNSLKRPGEFHSATTDPKDLHSQAAAVDVYVFKRSRSLSGRYRTSDRVKRELKPAEVGNNRPIRCHHLRVLRRTPRTRRGCRNPLSQRAKVAAGDESRMRFERVINLAADLTPHDEICDQQRQYQRHPDANCRDQGYTLTQRHGREVDRRSAARNKATAPGI
jgi:hypothetical protein